MNMLKLRAIGRKVNNDGRFVALSTGRVLSVRDQAIDTPLPSHGPLDQLTDYEAKIAPLFHTKSIWIFTHMIELRKIAGQILESIYIARGRDGRCSSLTFHEICAITDELSQRLDQWKTELDTVGIKSSREYKIMKIEYCVMLLHLNRPSPSFMIPSQRMVAICSHAASNALQLWTSIVADVGIDFVCRCYRHFHDILMVGLARLYCDWCALTLCPCSFSSQILTSHSFLGIYKSSCQWTHQR